jgi:hypothetical protein
MLIILRSLADEQRHDNSNNEANSNEADEDYVIKEDDVALDNYGKVDMERVFPNTDHDNPSQSSTSTPGTGLVLARVLLLDFCLDYYFKSCKMNSYQLSHLLQFFVRIVFYNHFIIA